MFTDVIVVFMILIYISIILGLLILYASYSMDKDTTINSPIKYTKKEFDYFLSAFSTHYSDTRYAETTKTKQIMFNAGVDITIWDDTEILVENYWYAKSYFPKSLFTYVYAKRKIKQLMKQLKETTPDNNSLMEVADKIISKNKVM